jgi:hypothetical protein
LITHELAQLKSLQSNVHSTAAASTTTSSDRGPRLDRGRGPNNRQPRTHDRKALDPRTVSFKPVNPKPTPRATTSRSPSPSASNRVYDLDCSNRVCGIKHHPSHLVCTCGQPVPGLKYCDACKTFCLSSCSLCRNPPSRLMDPSLDHALLARLAHYAQRNDMRNFHPRTHANAYSIALPSSHSALA